MAACEQLHFSSDRAYLSAGLLFDELPHGEQFDRVITMHFITALEAGQPKPFGTVTMEADVLQPKVLVVCWVGRLVFGAEFRCSHH